MRARSFYLQLLTEAIARDVLTRLGLPITNALYIGGGGFQLLALGQSVDALAEIELVQEWVEKHNDEWIRAGHTGADIKIATKKCIGWISTLTSPIAAALMSSMPISAATPHTKVDQPEIKKIDAEALKGWSTLGDNDKQARLLKILKYLPSETYKTIQKDSGLSFNLITRLSSSRLVSKGTLDKIKKVIDPRTLDYYCPGTGQTAH